MPAVVTARWNENGSLCTGGLDDVARAMELGAVWIDLLRPDPGTLDVLAVLLGLHPLQVEDCLHSPQRPKVDVYTDSIMLTWQAITRNDGDGLLYDEIDCILGTGYVLTSHEGPVAAIDAIAGEAHDVLARGPEWTLHAIIDRAVDEVFPIVDYVSDELDELEDRFISGARQKDLSSLYAIKRMLVSLHRVMAAERDAMRALARQEALVSREAYLYFQDVGDHLARAADSVDTYRDVASGSMDIYLSSQSNRMNEIMKRLTVVATIFMPLTLISGIYGMNLVHGMWPPVDKEWSFWVVVVSMVVIGAVMMWDFRRRDWW